MTDLQPGYARQFEQAFGIHHVDRQPKPQQMVEMQSPFLIFRLIGALRQHPLLMIISG